MPSNTVAGRYGPPMGDSVNPAPPTGHVSGPPRPMIVLRGCASDSEYCCYTLKSDAERHLDAPGAFTSQNRQPFSVGRLDPVLWITATAASDRDPYGLPFQMIRPSFTSAWYAFPR